MMAAGIIAYGESVILHVWIFSRMTANNGRLLPLRGFIAAALSQIVDTLIFITISFYGVRPIGELMLGQMIAKVVLSAVMVPLLVMAVVAIGRRLDGATVAGAAGAAALRPPRPRCPTSSPRPKPWSRPPPIPSSTAA